MAAMSLSLFCTGISHAQKLPEPARTVYKCTINGKIVYTDDPCPGATKVDVQPTRGMNKATGKELSGADVRRERHNEVMADALRPIINEDATQRETRHRRARLSPKAQAECSKLDGSIQQQEVNERTASVQERAGVQADLLRLRMRHRELGC
jgi:hypothetical protein